MQASNRLEFFAWVVAYYCDLNHHIFQFRHSGYQRAPFFHIYYSYLHTLLLLPNLELHIYYSYLHTLLLLPNLELHMMRLYGHSPKGNTNSFGIKSSICWLGYYGGSRGNSLKDSVGRISGRNFRVCYGESFSVNSTAYFIGRRTEICKTNPLPQRPQTNGIVRPLHLLIVEILSKARKGIIEKERRRNFFFSCL